MAPRIHFIGIGGIGMSALARWFLAQKRPKWAISGSDVVSSGTTRELKKEGVQVKIGHKKGHIGKNMSFVVYNNAIPPSNPELQAARKLGIPALSYPQLMGVISREYNLIAITGAHGKSTTCGLVSVMLSKIGLDPTVIIGTKLREFKGRNFRNGKSDWMVLEADDAHRAFLNYTPLFTIVTNIDREHMDTYRNLGDIKQTFLKFMSNTLPGGTLILNKDDKNLLSLKKDIQKLGREKKLKVLWYSIQDAYAKTLQSSLSIPGRHNLSNACAAFVLGKALNLPRKKILDAISGYKGSWRRMEKKGDCRVLGVRCHVYDDYAHHPTEIKAVIQGAKALFPGSKVLVVFQPHQAKRLEALFKEFAGAFQDADAVVLFSTYRVAGRDRRPKKKYGSRALSLAIKKQSPNVPVYHLSDPKRFSKQYLEDVMQDSFPFLPHDVVVVMTGAGDIVNYTQRLLKK